MDLATKKQTSIQHLNLADQLNDLYEYSENTRSTSSKTTYSYGWKKFTEWCEENNYYPLSQTSTNTELLIGLFLSSMAKSRCLKVASLHTYLLGIKFHYENYGIIVNIQHPMLKKVMKGIKRDIGTKQVEKIPLVTENIKLLVDSIDTGLNMDLRDKLIMLIGFYGAFRRSELVGIDFEHLTFSHSGLSIFMPKSKTDQNCEGRYVDIPFFSSENYCPVRLMKKWIEAAGITSGPIFVRVIKGQRISTKRLTGHSIAVILKKLCEPFGFSKDVAGHSLRSGHVTSAIKAGTPETWIMRQTGHTSIDSLRRYERMGREFVANSASRISI